ncbi:MAG TPA: hypothetical protein DIT07_05680, partial [Sphingobacteriaceae bacterium]|nr:hypothetical protein [Sphingobacteriaceae bacterium]
MKKIGSLCVLFIAFLVNVTAQDKLVSEKPIPIIAWADIPAGEINIERFNELKEMGVNVNLSNYQNADAMQKALDLAQRAGIRMITSGPELKTDAEKTVKRFMDHPALAGYFLQDEPVRKDFAELGV